VCSCPGVIYVGPQTLRETHYIVSASFALVSCTMKPKSCTTVLEVRGAFIIVSSYVDNDEDIIIIYHFSIIVGHFNRFVSYLLTLQLYVAFVIM